jgi:hypothetical protein
MNVYDFYCSDRAHGGRMLQDQPSAARAPRLWTIRGIGTAIIGHLEHPDGPPWCYKQFAVTFFYIPVWLGRYYPVRRSHKGGGWIYGAPVTGAEIVARCGRGAYWRFKLGVLVLPLIALSVFAWLLLREVTWKHP